jgi:hypothetical protein
MTSNTMNGSPRPRVAGKTKDELAAMAYGAVEGIEFLEMNDGHRLGYHVYRYLGGELPSLAEAIYEAKARTAVPHVELEQMIRERLVAAGVPSE